MFYGWKISLLSMSGNFMLQGTVLYCMNAFMEPLCALNGWTRAELNVGMGLATLVGQIAMPLAAGLCARHSLRRLMTIGAFTGGIATILLGGTTSLPLFTLLFTVAWVSTQICGGVVGNALVSNWFHHFRGRAFGLANAGTSLSGVILPLLSMVLINTFSVGNGATGTAKMLWDENNLYVLTEVTDPVLSKSSANAYEQDTVEVFFDENNHKTDYYETDDLQARVNYDNEKTITDGLSTDRFVSATAKTDKGYLVEMAIPFGIAPFKNGQVLGFDVQVNDDGTGDGKRTAISNWNDLTGMGYTSTAGYGVLTLTGGSSETTTSATTTIGTSTTTTTTATTVTTTDTLENINYGDVNLDGVVDLADSIVLNKYLAQVLTLSDMALKNADVNTDQNLTEKDTTILMRFILQDKDYPELPHVDAE